MSLEIKRSLSAIGDSLAYAYGAFTGIKETQDENTPPIGSRDQKAPQTVGGGGVGTAGLMGFGLMPLVVIGLGIWFMTRN
ncbi:hypothetical protein ES705_11649 [subsurface metagenome]